MESRATKQQTINMDTTTQSYLHTELERRRASLQAAATSNVSDASVHQLIHSVDEALRSGSTAEPSVSAKSATTRSKPTVCSAIPCCGFCLEPSFLGRTARPSNAIWCWRAGIQRGHFAAQRLVARHLARTLSLRAGFNGQRRLFRTDRKRRLFLFLLGGRFRQGRGGLHAS